MIFASPGVFRSRAVGALVALGFFSACGGGTEINGRVTDELGTQKQGLSLAPRQPGLGGEGSVAAASRVQAVRLSEGGGLEVLAEADVQADGTYRLTVPDAPGVVILQAQAADGKLISAAMVEGTDARPQIEAPPMDQESSVEVEVLLAAAQQPGAEVNPVDLRARVTSDIAAAVAQGREEEDKVRARIAALAEAIRAAQETEVKAYARAGAQVTQAALFEVEVEAGLALSAALAAGEDRAEAYAEFFAALERAAQGKGAEAKERAEAERQAGVAFRAVVQARLDADPVVDASVRAAAGAEARATAAAIEALVASEGAAEEVKQQAATAAASLSASVSAAATAEAAAQAYATFSAEIATDAEISSTVLGQHLAVSQANRVGVDAAVQATVTAGATLDAALQSAIDASVQANSAVDAVALAEAIGSAYATYGQTVRAQTAQLSAFGQKATPAVELLVLAEGSFRLGR